MGDGELESRVEQYATVVLTSPPRQLIQCISSRGLLYTSRQLLACNGEKQVLDSGFIAFDLEETADDRVGTLAVDLDDCDETVPVGVEVKDEVAADNGWQATDLTRRSWSSARKFIPRLMKVALTTGTQVFAEVDYRVRVPADSLKPVPHKLET